MGFSYFIYSFAFLFIIHILCDVSASKHAEPTTSDEDLMDWFANNASNVTTNIFTFTNKTDEIAFDTINETDVKTTHKSNNITTAVKPTTPESTTSSNFIDSSTTIKSNLPTEVILSVTTFEVSLETNENVTENNTALVNGSVWDQWKEIFTKSFWKKRFSDRSYTLALLLPIAIGVTGGCVICLCVFLCKRMCAKRRFVKNRIDKNYDGKTRDDKWMLLERQPASDTDEEV